MGDSPTNLGRSTLAPTQNVKYGGILERITLNIIEKDLFTGILLIS
jgi:hypothetical protein